MNIVIKHASVKKRLGFKDLHNEIDFEKRSSVFYQRGYFSLTYYSGRKWHQIFAYSSIYNMHGSATNTVEAVMPIFFNVGDKKIF